MYICDTFLPKEEIADGPKRDSVFFLNAGCFTIERLQQFHCKTISYRRLKKHFDTVLFMSENEWLFIILFHNTPVLPKMYPLYRQMAEECNVCVALPAVSWDQ